ncbi:MAG: KH domain-containing protein [Candidatus Pacebacteria bacterium]|nr:KH domain-containing protein [Candidatus Paceibacterota bacterium]
MTMHEYVTMLLAHMGCQNVTVEIEEKDSETRVVFRVPEEDSGMLIGHRGETLEALQRILTLTYRDDLADKRLTVEVNDYLDRRQEVVQRIADEALERVRATNAPTTLPYLSSEERRIVHTLLKEAGVETKSDGIGRDRRLTVYPVGSLPQQEEA